VFGPFFQAPSGAEMAACDPSNVDVRCKPSEARIQDLFSILGALDLLPHDFELEDVE